MPIPRGLSLNLISILKKEFYVICPHPPHQSPVPVEEQTALTAAAGAVAASGGAASAAGAGERRAEGRRRGAQELRPAAGGRERLTRRAAQVCGQTGPDRASGDRPANNGCNW